MHAKQYECGVTSASSAALHPTCVCVFATLQFHSFISPMWFVCLTLCNTATA